MIRAQIHVSTHTRSRPYSKEYEAVHAEMFAVREQELRIEAAVRLYVEPAIDEQLEAR